MSNPFDLDVHDDEMVECPECHEKTVASDWPEGDGVAIFCDDCGEHPGTECPSCGERFDLVFWETCDGCGRLASAYEMQNFRCGQCRGIGAQER